MPCSGDSSLHVVEITSWNQFTARLVQYWSSCRPIEPIEEISEHLLTLNTVLLLPLSSLKKVGDLQALSVAPSFSRLCARSGQSFLVPLCGL